MADPSALLAAPTWEQADVRLAAEELAFFLRWRGKAEPFDVASLAEAEAHVLKEWRELCSSGHSYRCVQSLAFLRPHITRHPAYASLLERSKAPDFRVADVGCALGQETRALLLDGVREESVLATDVSPKLWEAGKRFFDSEERNASRLQTAFGDWAAPPGAEDVATPFAGSFDALLSMLVLHVLSHEQQTQMLRRLARVAKPGCLLLGTCVGSEHAPGVWSLLSNKDASRWLQTADSLAAELAEAGWSRNVSTNAVSRAVLAMNMERGAAREDYKLTPAMGEMQIIIFSAERE